MRYLSVDSRKVWDENQAVFRTKAAYNNYTYDKKKIIDLIKTIKRERRGMG